MKSLMEVVTRDVPLTERTVARFVALTGESGDAVYLLTLDGQPLAFLRTWSHAVHRHTLKLDQVGRNQDWFSDLWHAAAVVLRERAHEIAQDGKGHAQQIFACPADAKARGAAYGAIAAASAEYDAVMSEISLLRIEFEQAEVERATERTASGVAP